MDETRNSLGLKKDCAYIEKCMYNMIIEMICDIGGRTSHNNFDCDACNCYVTKEYLEELQK